MDPPSSTTRKRSSTGQPVDVATDASNLSSSETASQGSSVAKARECMLKFYTSRRTVKDSLAWIRTGQDDFYMNMTFDEFAAKTEEMQKSAVRSLQNVESLAKICAARTAGSTISVDFSEANADDLIELESNVDRLTKQLSSSIESQIDGIEGLLNLRFINKKRRIGQPQPASAMDDTSLAVESTKIDFQPSKQVEGGQVAAPGGGRVLTKPQLRFRERIDNARSTPFRPKLMQKPFAKISLEDSMAEVMNDDGSVTVPHPYQFEINHLPVPDEIVLQARWEKVVGPEKVRFEYIRKYAAFVDAVNAIKSERLVAVDLEAHSYRTFLGLTCCIQLSTAKADYVIDTLQPKLRSQASALLNSIFANPDIVKVMHGADSDMHWLQRDFSVYVVNLFDTHRAAIQLQIPVGERSLAALLKRYLKIKLDKRYQRADWRLRPLPADMVAYARLDTRYLLPLYCRLVKLLQEAGGSKLQEAWQASQQVALLRFEKPVLFGIAFSRKVEALKEKKYTAQQVEAFRLLWDWRDKMARAEDESVGYVLPERDVMALLELLPIVIAERDKLSSSVIGSMILQRLSSMSSLLHRSVNELVDVLRRAAAFVPPLNSEVDDADSAGARLGSLALVSVGEEADTTANFGIPLRIGCGPAVKSKEFNVDDGVVDMVIRCPNYGPIRPKRPEVVQCVPVEALLRHISLNSEPASANFNEQQSFPGQLAANVFGVLRSAKRPCATAALSGTAVP